MTDTHLLARLQAGDEAALAELTERYEPYVCAVIRTILGDHGTPADVEELANDTFYALWHHAGVVRPGKLKAYLAATARNKAKSLLRRCKEPVMDLDTIQIPDGADPLEEQAIRQELAAAVQRAVDSLRRKDREIFLRYYFYYQDTETIAREMGIPAATVRSRLRRGREQLKKKLSKEVAP